MTTLNSFDDLYTVLGENTGDSVPPTDKSQYRNHSRKIALTVGYLLGVREDYFERIDDNAPEREELLAKLGKNNEAVVIRALNNIRSNLMLSFKKVSQSIRIGSPEYKPLYQQPSFEQDFKTLTRQEINIITGRQDINEYIRIINEEIRKRIDRVQSLFPEWLEFRHIRNMFLMPKNIEEESKKYQMNQDYYPFQRYFNWVYPMDHGNLLINDERLLTEIYANDGDTFMDAARVSDASDRVKNGIGDFIRCGTKTQIFVDGENIDPYNFAAAIDGLQTQEIEKIDRIVVYYDEMYSPKAWQMLRHFTFGIPVETVPVARIKEDKSLVDHKIVAGISKAFYQECVDSFILASSDSDFWAVIEDVPAKFLVMVERESCGYDFKSILRSNEIFYCYLDSFQTPEDDRFFNAVLKRELNTVIESWYPVGNTKDLFEAAVRQSRAELSEGAYENLYKKFVKSLRLNIDKNGNIRIVVED